MADTLEQELRAAELPRWEPRLPELVADVPGAFADDFDPGPAGRGRGIVGWWARRRLHGGLVGTYAAENG